MYRSSETLADLFAALAKAQGAFLPIDKDKSARIPTKNGVEYSYAYADLATVLKSARKALTDNGLALIQTAEPGAGGGVVITTLLGHASGQHIESDIVMPVGNPSDPRSVASAITYGRRYGALALLGIAPADEDDDAAEALPRPPNGRGSAQTTHPAPVATSPAPVAAPTAERADAPDGYRYIDDYNLENGWHHITFLRADAQGGKMEYATKLERVGAIAMNAFREGIPVKVEGAPRPGRDGFWLNKIMCYHPEDDGPPSPSAGDASPLSAGDIPF